MVDKTKAIISGIITVIIESLIPIRGMLIQQIQTQRSIEHVPLQTYLLQLIVIYGFVFIVGIIGVYKLLNLIFPENKNALR